MNYDIIIVGSGPAGAMVAETLSESPKKIAIVDVGYSEREIESSIPDDDFLSLRKKDINQYKYFLGENFESIKASYEKQSYQITAPRLYVIKDIQEIIPLKSDNFYPIESLAKGGLGSAWGLGCYTYSDEELKKTGLPVDEIKKAYQIVADRIGISADNDDIAIHNAINIKNLLPPINIDNSAQQILSRYLKNKNWFNKQNVYLGKPVVSILTEKFDEREATKYYDMDFYSDKGYSCYRPWMTIEKLINKNKICYLNKRLVLTFEEKDNFVEVYVFNLNEKKYEKILCKKLILACGTLGTARIILRSLKNDIEKLPILCNPYYYLPCINISMLGKTLSQYKTSTVQLQMLIDPDKKQDDFISVSLYSYRSLLNFRLLNYLPFGLKENLKILQFIQPAIMIAGVHYSDRFDIDNKYLKLIPHHNIITQDCLYVNYNLNKNELDKIKKYNKKLFKVLLKLGCIPIRKINPGYGSSIHYAGCTPFSEDNKKPGHISITGKLNNFNNIYIADSSGFKFLPAKGITFTLMAYAHYVATQVLSELD